MNDLLNQTCCECGVTGEAVYCVSCLQKQLTALRQGAEIGLAYANEVLASFEPDNCTDHEWEVERNCVLCDVGIIKKALGEKDD